MKTLGDIKWIFKENPNVLSIADLKDKVLKALGTYDANTGKWTAGQDLIDTYKNKSPAHWTLLIGSNQNPITSADDLINALSNAKKFNDIFEITK